GSRAGDGQGLGQWVGAAKHLREMNPIDLAENVIADDDTDRNRDAAAGRLGKYELANKAPGDQPSAGQIRNGYSDADLRRSRPARHGNGQPVPGIGRVFRQGPIQGSHSAVADVNLLAGDGRAAGLHGEAQLAW